jgi:Skp family chaperone for outer membrane proteins
MRRILAGALAVAICGSMWLAADEAATKKPVQQKATTSSAQQLRQMQTQLKKQQEQISKLQTQLHQSHQALQQAQQKLQKGAQQTSQQAQTAQQQAVSAQQSANGLNNQVTEMQTTLGSVGQKPQGK